MAYFHTKTFTGLYLYQGRDEADLQRKIASDDKSAAYDADLPPGATVPPGAGGTTTPSTDTASPPGPWDASSIPGRPPGTPAETP